MSSRPRPSRSISLTLVLVVSALVPGIALAQDQAPGPVQVQVQPVGSTGVAGIALLAPAGGGTAVQVLVMGAPEGTSAVIHPGGCDVPDASLVALLGDLGTGGQVQVTVPVPFETLTDGGHVVAFHPGLDMATLVGCGVIPAVAAPPDAPAASLAPPAPSLAPLEVLPEPAPTLAQPPPPEPAPTPAPDPACLEVAPWIELTEGRLTRVSEALSDLDATAARYDLPAYLAGLASLEGELRVMASQQAQGPVPAAAADLNQRALGTYEAYMDAARQLYESLTISVDVNNYSRALGQYEEATQLMGEVQRGLGELKGRCPTG